MRNKIPSIASMMLMVILTVMASFVMAHETKIYIHDAWIKAPLPGMAMTGGYAMITNSADSTDQLLSATGNVSKAIELHTMVMEDGVMKMREQAGGLSVQAGGQLELKPGGNHLMFIGITDHLQVGDKIKLKLEFFHAGMVEQEFEVRKGNAKLSHSNH